MPTIVEALRSVLKERSIRWDLHQACSWYGVYKQAILCHHNTEVSPDAATQQHQRWSSYLIRPLTLNLLLHINIKHSQTRLYFLASFEVKDSRHGLRRLMAQGRLNEVN